MSYLTYGEYISFGNDEIDQTEFNKLLIKASDVLDHVTRNFYQFNDLESDHEFRRTKFKKAVSAQIAFFHDMGGTSSHEINEPGTVTIGRTTVSKGGNKFSGGEESKNSIISEDVYIYLSGTGLLYRGIGVV